MLGRIIRRLLVLSFLATGVAAVGAWYARSRVESTGGPDDDEVTLAAIMDSLEFSSRAGAFRGGSLLCWFGGAELDLREATLDPAGATLDLKLLFGGGQLLVPDDWTIEIRTTSVLGGIGDARAPRDRPADAPRLVLTGFAALGGIGIMSSEDDIDEI